MDINQLQERRLSSAVDDLKKNFAQYWSAAFDDRREGTAALTAPASYRLDIDGTRLLIDPVFRFGWQKESVAERWKRDLADADGVIYTHSHADHYDPDLVREARDGGANIYLPDFIMPQDTSGISPIKEGKSFTIGKINITPYRSAHYSPDGMTGVPSYGYIIEYTSGVLLFPCDVRNYDTTLLPDIRADIVFAHVWLGRGNALNLPCEPYLFDFARFVLTPRPSKVFLAHLYEIGREPCEMWTYVHAGLCIDAMNAADPSVDTEIMRPGRIYSL
ncbi:MAG: MBL fold metallo-hydrolase [Clostridiales bacterium]|nr:MBL fold metallo-hydrolase [Clostridiales bacterium]